MFRLFKNLLAARPISQAVKDEVQRSLVQIQQLQKSNNLEDLKEGLSLIAELEKKYPFCYEETRYYRGQIGGEIIDIMKKNGTFKNRHTYSL